jgi:hypothetical protein
MEARRVIGATAAAALLGVLVVRSAQPPAVRAMDEKALREYAGVYQWEPNAFVYLQMWNEFSGFSNPSELVAFDESGQVRTLYPLDRDQFFAGRGMAVSTSIESRIEFQRDATGKILGQGESRGAGQAQDSAEYETSRHEGLLSSFARTFAILHSDRVALALSPFVWFIGRTLSLPTRALIGLANIFPWDNLVHRLA